MSKIISITRKNECFDSVFLDDGIPLKFNVENVLGDFLRIRTENVEDFFYDRHVFTVIDGSSQITPPDFTIQVGAALSCLDEFIIMVQQNSKDFLQTFYDILMSHGLKLNYRIMPILEDFDDNQALANQPISVVRQYLDKDYRISYGCHTISDLIVAVMHFYLINNFHFVQCLHCGRYYATQTLKQYYCGRISPYIDLFSQKRSEPKTCAETVKASRKQLNRRVRRIYAKIENRVEHQLGNHALFIEFSSKVEKCLALIKEESSVENLSDLNSFLEKVETMEELNK